MKKPEELDNAPIEELRELLARQILRSALVDQNLQLKLDAYKATQKPPDRSKQPETTGNDAMSVFQARVRRAAEAKDGADE